MRGSSDGRAMTQGVKQRNDKTWDQVVTGIAEAASALSLADCARIARDVQALIESGRVGAGTRTLRIALLRSAIVEPLALSLVAQLAPLGLAASVRLGQLGAAVAEMIEPDSWVRTGQVDVAIILMLPGAVLPSGLASQNASEADRALNDYLGYLADFAASFAANVIVCNFPANLPSLAPSLQAQQPASFRYFIEQANRRIAELAALYSNISVYDIAALACEIGLHRFWSPQHMLASMQPFEADAAVAIGRGLARLCSLIYSTGAVKCIVLDCDNTLWGGIIGEDGIAGIQIGETYPGVCFRQFQHQLLQLKQLGFLLAINSKNQEQDVRAVFERHPGMALRYDDFAAARINWDNKASNMLSLAEELNIGVDSFLFIDDNPFEVDLIRRELPAVRCLTMPADAWKIPMLLPDCGLADTLRVTSEDANRSRLYSDERQRSDLQKRCGTYDDYLASLGMTLTFECFDAEKHLSRAAQLTQKTNQFNLTTRRYTEADLRQAWENGAAIFMASLRDRFGDYGRILLAIVKRQARGIAELDTFLMSCRVIGRGVEDACLRLAMQYVRGEYGVLIAEYLRTPRNGLCADFLDRNGFTVVSNDSRGVVYSYDLSRGIADIPQHFAVDRGSVAVAR